MSDVSSLLTLLEKGLLESDDEWLKLKTAIKPIFYYSKGCMAWSRKETNKQIKAELKEFGEMLIASDISAEDMIVEYSNKANSLGQSAQIRTFVRLPDLFIKWPANRLEPSQKELFEVLKSKLSTTDHQRERVLMLIGAHAETSNGQSRKVTAGAVAETTIELVLKKAGLEARIGYGRQWGSGDGSPTDFIIPWKAHGDRHGIKAYIACQASSNDRSRMGSSELHRGAKRFICSLNGSTASSKNTDDIGLDLSVGLLSDETTYVVVEKERQRAISKAKADHSKEKNPATKILLEKRMTWLENFSCNFNQFSDLIKTGL